MFAALAARIGRLPWWGQAIAWPFFGVARLIGWVLSEMGGQATKGAKKVFAPFLWPVAALLFTGLLYATMSPEEFEALLGTLLQFAIAIVGLLLIVGARWPWSKKQKQKKKKT